MWSLLFAVVIEVNHLLIILCLQFSAAFDQIVLGKEKQIATYKISSYCQNLKVFFELRNPVELVNHSSAVTIPHSLASLYYLGLDEPCC